MHTPKAQKHEELRKQLWAILHDGKGMSGHVFNLILIVLIIVSLTLLPLEFIPQLSKYYDTLAVIEIFTAVLFTMEYAARIYAAPRRWKYIFSFYGLVDFFSIAPFYAGFVATQYLRVLRIIRLFKMGEMEAAAAGDEQEKMHEGIGLVDGENVEYVVSRHPIYLIIGSLPPLIASIAGITLILLLPNPATIAIGACLLLFAIIFLWKAWIDFSYDVIFVTNRRLILQTKYILGRSINQVNYSSITNVKPYFASYIGFFLRYGNILIETTAAEPGHIELRTVRRHEKAAHKIMEHCFTGPKNAG